MSAACSISVIKCCVPTSCFVTIHWLPPVSGSSTAGFWWTNTKIRTGYKGRSLILPLKGDEI